MFNKYHFRWLYTSDFIKTIDYYAKSLSEKILPSFKDQWIAEEANKIEEETYYRLASFADPEWYDPAADIDQARNAGIDFYMMAEGIKQSIINMFTSGLYHLFEQQLLKTYRQQLLLEFAHEQPPYKLLNVEEARKRLLNQNIDISTFATWGKLDELRLVANVVKHADGSSCDKLKQKRPDLFIHPSIQDYHFLRYTGVTYRPVYQPLAGEDRYISLEEFTKYVEAVKQFWEELAQAVDQLPG